MSVLHLKNNPAASATEVPSANVVGYTKLTLKPGYNTISAQFMPVGETAISDILSVMDATNLPTMDVDTETGYGFARLQTWDPKAGYTIYEWTGEGIAEAWEWEGIDNKWLTVGSGDIAEVEVASGEGVWLWLDPEVVSENITITVAGEVSAEASKTIPLVAGYNLIANPFPKAIGIQDITFNNLPTMDVDTETGYGFARLQTWDPKAGYTIYEWTGEGIAEAWEWEGIDNKWLTVGSGDIAANVEIPVGGSFWLWLDPTNPGENVSVTFTK